MLLLLYGFLFGMQTLCAHTKSDDPEWNHLSVTFTKWYELPLNELDAIQKKWTLLSDDCFDEFSPFLGRRYWINGDRATILIFDAQGLIAGLQMGYEVNNDAAVPNPNPNSEALLKVRENGKWYIYMTAYFTDPNNICRIGKRTCGRESSVVGDRLVFLHRGNKYMDIPLSEEQLKGTKWVQGNCAPRMGTHYWYGTSRDMNCDDMYPFFLLYNEGKLQAFGLGVFEKIFSPMDRLEHPPPALISRIMHKPAYRPRCASKVAAISSQHVFFTKVTDTSHQCSKEQLKLLAEAKQWFAKQMQLKMLQKAKQGY